MAQKLTYAKVLKACRKAWEDGTLLARAMYDGRITAAQCKYVSHLYVDGIEEPQEFRCAIGAALNLKILAQIQTTSLNGCSVGNLASDGYIEAEPHELRLMTELQYLHDKALQEETIDAYGDFCARLGVKHEESSH